MVSGIKSLFLVDAPSVNLQSTGLGTGYFYPYDRKQIIPVSFIIDSAKADHSLSSSNELELSLQLEAHPNSGAAQLLKRADLGLVIESHAGEAWYMPTRVVTSSLTTGSTTREANKEVISVRNGIKPCGWFCFGQYPDLAITVQVIHENVQNAIAEAGGTAEGVSLSALDAIDLPSPEWQIRYTISHNMIWVCLAPKYINGVHWHMFYYANYDSTDIQGQLYCLSTRHDRDMVAKSIFIPVEGSSIDTWFTYYSSQEPDLRYPISIF